MTSTAAGSQVTLASRTDQEISGEHSLCWQRRSRLEKRLLSVTTLFLFLSVGLAIAVGFLAVQLKQAATTSTEGTSSATQTLSSTRENRRLKDGKPVANASRVCDTPGCVLAASELIKDMDDSVDPCEDFYSFACGGFQKRYPIPDDKSQVTAFSVISDKIIEQLRVVIEQPVKPDEPDPFRLVKNLYQSCLNKARIEELGLQPLKEVLQKFGGWPAVEGDKWDNSSFVWYETIYKLREVGYSVDYIVDFSVLTDLKNSTYRVIELDQPAIGMPGREYILRGLQDKDVKAYLDFQIGLATLVGADKERATKELTESLLFEMQLANISLPREERRNTSKLYNPMTIEELSKRIPSIPWLDYINTILAPHHVVTSNERIIVSSLKVLEKLAALLETTPKRVVANYLLWRVAGASVSYLNEDARNLQLKYSSALTGTSQRQPRWKECVGVVTGSLGNAVGSLYVRSYFKEDAKKSALEMVSDLRGVFSDIIENLDWMDPQTKERAKHKASSMASHIGYPEELLDDKKLTDVYKNLELDPTNYLGNGFNMSVFGTNYAFRRLREPINKTDWISHGRPAVVNAYYSLVENSIQFPAGILQGAFFNKDRPAYLNYGAIGFVIGHEITHGFDDQGRQFDAQGNLDEWWLPQTKQNYLSRAQCFVQQYGNFSYPHLNLTVNGANTLGENIADNGGVKEAYLAYQKWASRHKTSKDQPWDQVEPALPGLSRYNNRQLFWLAAANIWCAHMRPDALKLRIRTGAHTPQKFRVLGTFANRPEFAEDFQCKPGSSMNPAKRCSLW